MTIILVTDINFFRKKNNAFVNSSRSTPGSGQGAGGAYEGGGIRRGHTYVSTLDITLLLLL